MTDNRFLSGKFPLFSFLYHDIILSCRQSFSWITPLIFFIMVVCLFPIALGPDATVLNKIAPGIIWVAALLAILISLGKLFQDDIHEGHLDLLLLSPRSLTLLVCCKVLSFWMIHCLPLILISPLLGLLLHLNLLQESTLIVTLLLGTPVFCLLGAIGAALTVGIRGHSLLLPILIMPLYLPILIFGTGAVMTVTSYSVNSDFAIMGAILLISLAFAPLLTGAALRIGVNQ
jgi:heme exporter protein B